MKKPRFTLAALKAAGDYSNHLGSYRPASSHPAAEQATSARSYLDKVLLVDDDPINSQVVLAVLRRFEVAPDAVDNGIEALRRAEADCYSLVLLDLHMPEMSGFETALKIRALEKRLARRRTTIVAMTASVTDTVRRRCVEAGMDDLLTKPIHPDLLLDHLRQQKLPMADEAALSRDLAGQELWNRTRAFELVGGDQALFLQIAAVFLGRNDVLLQKLAMAIEFGDADDLLDAAHAYRGAVGHFACPILRQAAMALEQLARQGQAGGVEGHLALLREKSRLLCNDLQHLIIEARRG